ncbi:MAG: D-Ala-D-Ala carboxypeptidase family metallohydrolase [Chthoniobacterales bacterium]
MRPLPFVTAVILSLSVSSYAAKTKVKDDQPAAKQEAKELAEEKEELKEEIEELAEEKDSPEAKEASESKLTESAASEDAAGTEKIGPAPTDAMEATGVPEGAEDGAHERDGCGAEVVGLDPLMAAKDREGDVKVKNAFMVKFQDEISPYTLISTSVMPGETMEVEAVLTGAEAEFTAEAEGGTLEKLGPEKWRWTAPEETGYYCVKITEKKSGETACVNTFVLVPFDGESKLNGYNIGNYEKIPLKGDPAYRVPEGFIEVTEENVDTWVSPHFQLRQFICKQQSEYPKYCLISPRLLLKLELILEQVEAEGIEAGSFYVMSGYRTPAYNRAIGNKTKYSRHSYGDAADIFVDFNEDGKMDDLNEDGKVTNADPKFLYDLVEEMTDEPFFKPFTGGLGFYEMKYWRTGFIHVDTRGTEVRW